MAHWMDVPHIAESLLFSTHEELEIVHEVSGPLSGPRLLTLLLPFLAEVNPQASAAPVELPLPEAKELAKRPGAAKAAIVVDNIVTLQAVLQAFQVLSGKEVSWKERRGLRLLTTALDGLKRDLGGAFDAQASKEIPQLPHVPGPRHSSQPLDHAPPQGRARARALGEEALH